MSEKTEAARLVDEILALTDNVPVGIRRIEQSEGRTP